MIRKSLCIVVLGCALGLSAPGPVSAAGAEDAILMQLKAQGFTRMRVTRTFLGRTRIVATSRELRREIVFNPATGEILRDYWVRKGGQAQAAPIIVDPTGGSSGGSGGAGSPGGGAGGGGFEDGDEDEDGEDEDDDDDEDDDEDEDDDDEEEDARDEAEDARDDAEDARDDEADDEEDD